MSINIDVINILLASLNVIQNVYCAIKVAQYCKQNKSIGGRKWIRTFCIVGIVLGGLSLVIPVSLYINNYSTLELMLSTIAITAFVMPPYRIVKADNKTSMSSKSSIE